MTAFASRSLAALAAVVIAMSSFAAITSVPVQPSLTVTTLLA